MSEAPVIAEKDQTAPVARIVAAARTCFAQLGVDATKMGDVADEAGFSRAYMYRFVKGRPDLIELALLARLNELGDVLADNGDALVDTTTDVADAIVEQTVAGIQLGHDPEYAALSAAMPLHRLNWILTGTESPIHEIVARAYGSLFARALAERKLRTDIAADAMIEWIQGILGLLSGRDDLNDAELRFRIRGFLLPALLR